MADLFKDILPDINHEKKNLIRSGDMSESDYGRSAFMVNRALSMNVDTVLYANEMNHHYELDALLQYDYFINSIRKKKRFGKWAKAPKAESNLELIKEYYNYNEQRAREALAIMTDEQLQDLQTRCGRGGNDTVSTQRRRT